MSSQRGHSSHGWHGDKRSNQQRDDRRDSANDVGRSAAGRHPLRRAPVRPTQQFNARQDDDQAHDWRTNVEYEMRADGHLYTLGGIPASRSHNTRIKIDNNGVEVNTSSENGDDYRYNDSQPLNKLDSIKRKQEKENQLIKDSLERAKEKIDRQLEKLDNTDEPMPLSAYKLPLYGPVM